MASADMMQYVKTQIKQIKDRLPDDPMFSKKGLNVCASCHQVVGSVDNSKLIKHQPGNERNHIINDAKVKFNNQENKISPNFNDNNQYDHKNKKKITIPLNNE